MNKTTRNIIVIVGIILLIFGIVLAIYSHLKTDPMDTNTTSGNVLDDANTGLENLLNNILNEDTANNETTNNTNTENSNTQNKNQTSSNNNDKAPTATQSTPKEKKAIELVKAEWKKEWGNLNDVSFNNEMIQGDGKYVVSVNDSKTTNVIRRYVVDTTTGVVEERF